VNWEDEANSSFRAQLARLFDRTPATDAGALIDLVIIDEAHYLRNPSTASNRLARLLRETARHLLLLTATPVQLQSDNLYQLLRLIDPDFFFDSQLFDALLQANRPVVAALRNLWGVPPDLAGARGEVEEALRSPFLSGNGVLRLVADELGRDGRVDEDARVRLGHQLEVVSLLSQYLTRTRKRDVIERRVERVPRVLTVSFSEEEKTIYDRITARIRARARGYQGVALFQEIARQRRMASCMVAALRAWGESGDLEQLLWEDLGLAVDLEEDAVAPAEPGRTGPTAEEELGRRIDYEALERVDSKYRELLTFLRGRLADNPREKFVLFAFFRGTLAYLRTRLDRDGIRSTVIQGGMGDEKWEVIERFRETDTLNVLLSSDVGSEGIDLQFCRFLINYDLPWNPMKVEQRIGRIDRLGQKAGRIFIVSFALKDTIEDRILQRLYARIRIFQESVGDLEEILGRMTERLLVEMFTDELTDEEMQRRADQVAMAIAAGRAGQERLENEAINLLAFSDYILQAVARSRDRGRWLQPEEIRLFVEDFFTRRYPGSVMRPDAARGGVYLIALSTGAKMSLQSFLFGYTGVRTTDLHRANEVPCFFDPRQAGVMGRRLELLDQTHPLIRWIRTRYEEDGERFHTVAAVSAKAEKGLPPGRYVYAAHLWRFSGLRRESRIAYKVIRLGDGAVLSDEASEDFVAWLARHGAEYPNARNLIDMAPVCEQAERCEEVLLLAYDRDLADFSAENENRCAVQEKSARQYHDRRVRELMERIERFRTEGKTTLIPATEGLIRKLEGELAVKLERVQRSRVIDDALVPLALGVADVA
jgi:superfamily II DNA or RNA helicase